MKFCAFPFFFREEGGGVLPTLQEQREENACNAKSQTMVISITYNRNYTRRRVL